MAGDISDPLTKQDKEKLRLLYTETGSVDKIWRESFVSSRVISPQKQTIAALSSSERTTVCESLPFYAKQEQTTHFYECIQEDTSNTMQKENRSHVAFLVEN